MSILALKQHIKKNPTSLLFLIILLIITSVITYFKVLIQTELGPIWDTFDFLSNAMYFAGQGFGYGDFVRPPFLSFVTSLVFRLGFISESTIFAIDGVFFVFGVIGLYLFFKLRFSSFQSFFGCLIFITFPLVLAYVSIGLSDIPSISLSIWALYFTVLAVRRNSKFFYISLPFFMLAFLTRYPAALIIFPMIFYILVNRKEVNYKNLLLGVLLSILVLIPVFIFFFEKFGNPISPFIVSFGVTQNIVSVTANSPENPFYRNDLLYFLKNIPLFIGGTSNVILLVSLMGIYIYFVKKIKEKSIKTISLIANKIEVIIFTILLLLFIVTFGNINYMGSEILFLLLGFSSYRILKRYNLRNIDIDFLFMAWFMSFFIFNSVFIIKDERYFLAMAPAVTYFLMRGFFWVFEQFKWEYKSLNLFKGLSIILIIMVLFSTTSFLLVLPDKGPDENTINDDTLAASDWFKQYEPDYKNKVIYADLWPYFNWHLKTKMVPMPVLKGDKLYYYRLISNTVDSNDNIKYDIFLNKNNAEYYFSDKKELNLTLYKPIKQFGSVTIYQRI